MLVVAAQVGLEDPIVNGPAGVVGQPAQEALDLGLLLLVHLDHALGQVGQQVVDHVGLLGVDNFASVPFLDLCKPLLDPSQQVIPVTCL